MKTVASFFLLAAGVVAQVQSGQVYHGILAAGQSLATACQGYASGQVTSGTPYSNLTLSAGSTTLEDPTILQLDVAPLKALAPWNACNNTGSPPDGTNPSGLGQEVPSLSTVNQLTYVSGGASGTKYILGMHGASGRSYLNVGARGGIGGPTDVAQPSPNPAFADALTQAAAMKAASIAAGSSFQLDAVILTHGESDEIDRDRIYDLYLNHFQRDYEQQMNALLGRRGLLPMFYNQQQSWGFYHGAGAVPITAVAQWKAAENNPGRLFLTGPLYYLPSGAAGDGVHRSPQGYRSLGEVVGKAMDWVLRQHKAWVPVMPKTITLSGSTITAKFFVPVGNLQLDTTTIAAQTNDGFEFTDGRPAWVDRINQVSGPPPVSPVIVSGGSGYTSAPVVTVNGSAGTTYTANISGGVVTSLTRTATGANSTVIDILIAQPTPTVKISSVTITASDTAQIILSGPPTGPAPSLRYAYTAPAAVGGGAGNLRDTDPTAGRTGSNLSDWCVTFDAVLPFTSKLLNVQRSASAGAQ